MQNSTTSKMLHIAYGACIASACIAGAEAYREYNSGGAPMPDPKLTPGAVMNVSSEECCVPGYSATVRHVTAATKQKVFKRYGILNPKKGQYEIDHLISLELGGSNEIENLWPQPYDGPWNAHMKDALENKLHSLVCSGKLTLPEAQVSMKTDWVDAYEKYISH